MKQQWQRLAVKIDAMSLRERAAIFAMAALIVVTLVNTLMLDPLLARQKALSQRVVAEQGSIADMQMQIQALVEAHGADPDAANRLHLAGLQQQRTQLAEQLQILQKGLVPPEKMPELLQDILKRQGRLQLVALNTLPVTGLAAEKVKVEGQQEIATSAQKQVYMHGVEITVQGSYADLLGYLTQLEHLPWQMFWGKVSLEVKDHPLATLTLTLYTLSLDKTWLSV
jgi:MSHA biogenesis protein MshJ